MTATNREPIKTKGGDDMEIVKRIIHYMKQYGLMTMDDVLDAESMC